MQAHVPVGVVSAGADARIPPRGRLHVLVILIFVVSFGLKQRRRDAQ